MSTVGDVLALGAEIFSSFKSADEAIDAIREANAIYREGAQQAANILEDSYDEGAGYRLGANEINQGYNADQLEVTNQMLGDSFADYEGRMTGAAGDYATTRRNANNQFGVDLGRISDQFGGTMSDLASTYAGSLSDIAGTYGSTIRGAAGDYRSGLGANADTFAGRLMQASDMYRGDRMAGLDAMGNNLGAYQEGRGTPALNFLNRLVGMDPASLTPSQAKMREDYIRDMSARNASGGLRGAGRAGVAAVNEGEADLMAQFYDTNLNRGMEAANRLAQLGYGASTQLGSAADRAYGDIARTGYGSRTTGANYQAAAGAQGLQAVRDAANQAAQAQSVADTAGAGTIYDADVVGATYARDTGDRLATTTVQNENDIAANTQGVAQNVADQGLVTDNAAISASDRYYDQTRDGTTLTGDILSDAAISGGAAQAGAVADPAYMDAQGRIAQGQITAETIGSAGQSAADALRR